jgi:hypothetical protein
MSNTHSAPRWLVAAVLAFTFAGAASAGAYEAHNPVEPPFATSGSLGGLAVDLSNGNLYATYNPPYPAESSVEVFGPMGGTPAGGVPSSLTGAGNFEKSFSSGRMNGVAVDTACTRRGLSGSECETFDPSSGDIYVSVAHTLYKYRVNGASEYEYICAFRYFGGAGSRCLPTGGEESEVEGSGEAAKVTGEEFAKQNVAVDSAGNVYVCGKRKADYREVILEFNSAGESLRAIPVPEVRGSEQEVKNLAVAAEGTLYIQSFQLKEVFELKRGSPTGPVEGQPAPIPASAGVTGLAFDQADGQLFVDLGSSVLALNGAHEVLSSFGAGIVSGGKALAIDEGAGAGREDVYVANEAEHAIDVFGPGVPATLPAVEEPRPSASDMTRTSALISGAVDPGNAPAGWRLEYVAAAEYQPAAGDPYAAGGSTSLAKLAPTTESVGIGPVPLTGLLAGTTYHYRLVASNPFGTTYGQDQTFTTAAGTPPIVTTGAAGEVTQTGVSLSGTVDTRELQTSYEFEVGTDSGYGGAKLFGNAGRGGVEAVSASLQFLIPGTTYHYRLVASNEDGTSYGQDMSFTTPGVSAPIAQPPTAALIASPTVVFPSVAGAITKPRGAGKAKKKTKVKSRRSRTRAKRGAGTKRAKHGAGAKRAKHGAGKKQTGKGRANTRGGARRK